MRLLFYLCLLILPILEAGSAVVVTYRGDNPNIFPVSSFPSSGSLDINNDGINDFEFMRDGGLVVSMRGYKNNRLISTLSPSPDVGGNIAPVAFGDILGPNTFSLNGDWHHHTDNGGGTEFGLFAMQSVDGYIGVEFDINGNIHYGWIQYTGFYVAEFTFFSPDGPITIIGANFLGGFINSWGYETEPGVSIIAGIPEPSTSLLFLMGGIALTCRRDRTTRSTTRRGVATPTSRSVSMFSRNYKTNPVIDVRRRW
jgi:hypothetical protein